MSLGRDQFLRLSTLGYAYAKSGNKPKALELIRRLQVLSKQNYVPPAAFVLVYASLGEADQTLFWFQRAYKRRFGR